MKAQKHRLELVVLALGLLLARPAHAQQPVVRAVLFYSPSCGHCYHVITEVLPPLGDKYGAQLQIAGVDVTSPTGQTLYQAAVEQFDISDERRGVPLLVVETTTLVGSQEIPEKFPPLVEQFLAAGGADWPAIPGLVEALAASEPAPEATAASAAATPPANAAGPVQATPAASAPVAATAVHPGAAPVAAGGDLAALEEATTLDVAEKLRRDPAGNALSILLLAAMLAVLAFAIVRLVQAWPNRARGLWANGRGGWRDWAIAGLCLLGLGVSIYLAFVETTHTAAVCGPVGDCNTVQQSTYAFLFGLLPIGVLGVLGYAAMLAAWAARRWGRGKLARWSEQALLAMALLGILFSIYLTFLEPFVIGATCIWCLTSALCMALILLILVASISVRPVPATNRSTSYA